MNLKTTKLRDAITFALVAGTTSLVGTGVAVAQDSAEATTLDRIQVTGSRIRQVEMETAQPVLTITRAEIENQGFQSVADILQNISAAGTPSLSRASPLSAGETAGGQFISLRGLGAQRTLVLVNGKRLGISTGGLQDISTIPSSIVERIEVLKDGASTIYGSDAIAGVVNIITRSNFEGVEGNVYYGQYDEGDGSVERGDIVLGAVSDRGSITAAFEYSKENAVRAPDRPFSRFPQGDRYPNLSWTSVGEVGGFVSSPTQNPVPGFVYPDPTGSNPTQSVRLVLRDGGNPQNPADYRVQNLSAPDGDVTNSSEQMDLRTPTESKSIFVSGSYDLTDNVRFRGDANYTNRTSARTVAGYPFQSASFNSPTADFSISPDSAFNPIDEPIANWWRRTWEVPRYSESDLDTLRLTGGLEGFFEVGDRIFDWDVSYLYNSNKVVQSSYGNLNLANVARSVGASFINADGVVQCGTAANPIALGPDAGQCMPWNPFLSSGTVGPGGLTGNQALQDYLFQEEHATGETTTNVVSANIAGTLFPIQGGDVAFALGAEHRRERGEFIPDALSVSGNSTNLASRPTSGGYEVNEIYTEFQIPLLADLPGAQELVLTAATRYSDYDTFGDTINSKFGFTWRPIDSLMVRGTWSEGFRAPTISNLYGGGSQSFVSYTDPCDPVYGAARSNAATAARCAAAIADYANFRQLQQGFVPSTSSQPQTPVAFFQGVANPNLQPETSISKTLGFVWSPGFVTGLNMSLDWWQIEIKDMIVADTAGQMLTDCYVENIAERCVDFSRDSVLGYVNSMNLSTRNAAIQEVEGYDFDLSYRLDTDFGNLSLDWQTTYISRNEFWSSSSAALPTQNVSFASSGGSTFRVRSNASLSWTLGDFGATWGVRYYSGLKESCLSAVSFPDQCSNPGYIAGNPSQTRAINESGSVTFNDLQLRWNAPWNATVGIGANNVFDRLGPPMYSQPNANFPYNGEFDIGRFVYMRYQQRF
ncbi:TonB-dependent receptor plug domain-containing protein [Luteimonas abyssi]|uniref:TonB-dependent receptor plug domain-containing protein n=1 Tax=Luteimonas abyssi TaxID=1247514 RepID=UPI000737C64B|nr:TonB-dependent receptor [Luteimonas abyssi]